MPARSILRALAPLVVTLASGCGSPRAEPAASGPPMAGDELVVAIAKSPDELDPLLGASRSDLMVSRQSFEPLIERLRRPYGDGGTTPGLVLASRATAGDTEWRLRLREGVRFQDGALMSASAVLANLRRWLTTPEGRLLLPGLTAVDAPKPDEVRLFFDRPVPDLRRLLASPRLGIVSPRALVPHSGEGARLGRAEDAGTGPFELREHARDELTLARNLNWWGTSQRLGPVLDQATFRAVPGSAQRLALLRTGEAQVADRLGPAALRAIARDPLLIGLPAPGGTGLGLERSVRGIDNAVQLPLLSEVWLTRIGVG